MLKKSIIAIVAFALIMPASNLFAEEIGPKARENLKQQPRTRIQKLEERLERIEKMLQNRNRARQKALTGKKEQPAKQTQRRQKAQQGRQQMQKWFDELEKAYDQKDMKKIGQLIEERKKLREQMKKRRAEFRRERPGRWEGFGGGFGQGRRFDDRGLQGRSGRGDRGRFRRRAFQGGDSCPCPCRSDYYQGRRRDERPRREYSDWDW